MADYNVNMKQWNGSSFDNVLPLAFNSKALDGKSYDDIIQYVQSYSTVDRLVEHRSLSQTETINVSWNMTEYAQIEIIVSFYITGGSTMTYNVALNNINLTYMSAYGEENYAHMILCRMSNGEIGYTNDRVGGRISITTLPFDSLTSIKLSGTSSPKNATVEIIGLKK